MRVYYNLGLGYIEQFDTGITRKIGGAVHINCFALDEKYHGLVQAVTEKGLKINLSDILLDDCMSRIEEIRRNHLGFMFVTLNSTKEGYVEHILYENGYETLKSVDKSEYYRLFFSEDSYRQNCYNCEYASVNKPADITVGDYFECKKDYPYLFENNGPLSNAKSLSCCIIHTEKGLQL